MPILKSEKVSDYKNVGILLATDMHNYITLYTLAKGYQKTLIIRGLIEKWKESQKETEDELIKLVIYRVNNERKSRLRKKSLTQFCVELRDELKKRKLSEAIIDKIIKGIKD